MIKKDRHEGFIFTGIQTFMESKYISLKEANNYDAVFLGIPTDHGISYREGANLGPKAIREMSCWEKVNGNKYFDLLNNKVLNSNNLKLGDIGDYFLNRDLTNIDGISEIIKNLKQVSFPITAGGDHSISYYTIKGVVDGLDNNFKDNIGIIVFDAHCDLEGKCLGLGDIHHGNSFRKLIEEGYIKSENLHILGPRGIIPENLHSFISENNVNLYTIPSIRKVGFNNFLNSFLESLKDKKYSGLYISIDIDSIDPSEVKGTGTPVANGFHSFEMEEIVKKFKEFNVLGIEIVELAPQLDLTGYSTIVAVNILWNFLSFGFNKTLGKK